MCRAMALAFVVAGLCACHSVFPFSSVSGTDGPRTEGLTPARDARGEGLDARATDRGAGDSGVADAGPDTTIPGTVQTVAGEGDAGSANGPALLARFSGPAGIEVDSKLNVYVTEEGSHRIRLISGGQVSTFAGTGTSGTTGGLRTLAQFNMPSGLLFNANQTQLYVADYGNHTVRVIDMSTGQVTLVAGNPGNPGTLDGAATTQAHLGGPHDLAMDTNGTIYVAEFVNHRIRKIAGGQVSTLAGSSGGYADQQGTSAMFSGPSGLALDAAEAELRVADAYNQAIRRITLSNMTVSTELKNLLPGTLPTDIELALSGFYYVVHETKIFKLVGSTATPIAGTSTAGYKNGPLLQAQFKDLHSLALGKNGAIYVTDFTDHRVRVIYP